jgi:nitrate reductase NapAB chaperone NapD
MAISSLVVNVTAPHAPRVAEAIRAIPRVDVTDVLEDRLIVVSETRGPGEARWIWEQIEAMEHVRSAALAYHNFEDLD